MSGSRVDFGAGDNIPTADRWSPSVAADGNRFSVRGKGERCDYADFQGANGLIRSCIPKRKCVLAPFPSNQMVPIARTVKSVRSLGVTFQFAYEFVIFQAPNANDLALGCC